MAGLPHTGILAFLYILFVVKPKDEEEEAQRRKEEAKSSPRVNPIPKAKEKEKKKEKVLPKVKSIKKPKEEDNNYKKIIGKVFEKQGNLVIYNGFIRASADAGVDIIVISMDKQSIELIQCKNWTKKQIELEDLANSYKKLNHFDLRHISHSPKNIFQHLQIKSPLEKIEDIMDCDKENFILRKTLYIRSDEVIDIEKNIERLKSNIFRYEEMKIVIMKI
jgi:hypothetical protein